MDNTQDYNEALQDQGKSRRPRGWLATDVKRVVDAMLENRKDGDPPITPYRISRAFAEVDGLDELPSPGSVAEVLRRWDLWNFAVIKNVPLQFVRYTELAVSWGMDACMKAYQSEKKSERNK